ncbi:MAG: dipeptidase [Lachnospiraceae bacterium]|nr:dipeptidase [Lachnospiraceae bacterium]
MRIIDMHCDTIHKLWEAEKQGIDIGLDRNDLMIDLEKMKKGGYLVQNFALFIEQNPEESSFGIFEELLAVFRREMERNEEWISQVLNTEDILDNIGNGKMSALLTVEGGEACEGSLEKLAFLYGQGVRMMTLTWNYPNEIGYPNVDEGRDFYTPDTIRGLTEVGIAFVEEMEKMGMIIDVSHLSDAGFYDVLKYTRKPFVASHSNSRSVCPWVRNLTDEMIYRIGERGGVIGLNYCADFLREPSKGGEGYGMSADKRGIEDIVRHAKHIVDVGGIECLGLGSDFDGIPSYPGCPKAENMEELAAALVKAGFHESEVDRILYGNVFCLYQEILG